MNELVSVIIPTYNRSHLVTEAIDSVLAQTYTNIEIIVVNDGSTDDTEEKLQPYMDKIVYIKKEKGGLSSALNMGLRVANGEYIARLDDDDSFMPDKVKRQLETFAEDPEIGLVTCGYFIIDEVGRPSSVKSVSGFKKYGPFLSLLLMEWGTYPSTVILRREVHDQVGLYKNIFCEDLEMFLRVSRYWNVGVVDHPLVKYRWHTHTDSITLNTSREKKHKDISDFTRDILDDVQLEELFPVLNSASSVYCISCAHAAKGYLYLLRGIVDRVDSEFREASELCLTNSIPVLWRGISAACRGNFLLAEQYIDNISKGDVLYPMAQDVVDSMMSTQINQDTKLQDEWMRDNRQLFIELFEVTFDGINGRSIKESYSREADGTWPKASQYNVIVENYPQDGEHLVFNTLTHAMVNVGNYTKELIQDPSGAIDEDALRATRILRKMGILVEQEVDESNTSRSFHENRANDMSSIYATILTTYDCNFACRCCIEKGIRKPAYMDKQCSDRVISWLEEKAERNATQNIILRFYGGEPLLNTEPMLEISGKLQKYAIDRGIILSISIITNGSLLNDELLLERMVSYGLISVKVTIDGPQETHDDRRPFRNGSGSFGTIIENIQKLPDTIELVIQTNLDSSNIDQFPHLLDYLEKSGLKEKIDNMKTSFIAPSLDLSRGLILLEDNLARLAGSRIADDLIHMQKLIIERGFRSQYDTMDYAVCSMNRNENMLIIDPLGIIYNCPAFVGREDFSIGDIYREEPKPTRLFPRGISERCLKCTYFPICGGGCQYLAYRLYGDYSKICCEKRFIRNRIKEFIKLDYCQRARW